MGPEPNTKPTAMPDQQEHLEYLEGFERRVRRHQRAAQDSATLAVGSLLVIFVLSWLLYSSVIGQRNALLSSKADAAAVAKLAGDISALDERTAAVVRTQNRIDERLAQDIASMRAANDRLRAHIDEAMAWAVTTHKRIREPEDIEEDQK